MVLHQYAFHMLPVKKAEQVFHCAVQPGNLPPGNLGRGYVASLCQTLPQLPGEIRHLFKGFHPNLVKPAEHLPAAVSGLPPLLQPFLKLFLCF